MVQFLGHIAFRIWFTLVVGFVACLFLLPLVEPVTGLSGVIYPAAAMGALVYAGAGFLGNRMGRLLMTRLIREAETRARAGDTGRARTTFERALGVFDSFLISPLERKRSAPRIGGSMARFHLAAPDLCHDNEAFVIAYLESRPDDREVAEAWLRGMQGQRKKGREVQELAFRIGKAQPDNPVVQASLAGLYLAWGRSDFAALQTYRKVMARGGRAQVAVARGLSRIFLEQGRADYLALSVYLSASRAGKPSMGLLRGIAASVHWMEETGTGSPLKEKGKKLLAGLDDAVLERMREGFNPPALDAHKVPGSKGGGGALFRAFERAGSSFFGLGGFICRFPWGGRHRSDKTGRKPAGAEYTGRFLGFSAVAAVVLFLPFLVVNTANHLAAGGKKVEERVPGAEQTSFGPFTIQVAAYLTPVHARDFTARLNAAGVDAHWNEVSGRKKQWYQVRVSHFPTRDAARECGERLKARGIIDDFFVANRMPFNQKHKEIKTWVKSE